MPFQEPNLFSKKNGVVVVIGVVQDHVALSPIIDQVEVLSASGVDCIVIDIKNCEDFREGDFVALVSSFKKAFRQSCEIRFCGLQPKAKDYLYLTRAEKIFEIYDTVEDALIGIQNEKAHKDTSKRDRMLVTLRWGLRQNWDIILALTGAFLANLYSYSVYSEDVTSVLLSAPITIPCIYYSINKLSKMDR